jgi:sortase A
MSEEDKAKHGVWRRRIANLLILAGVALVLYPVGTWVVTWWNQRALEQALVDANPALAQDASALLDSSTIVIPPDFGDVEGEQQTVKSAGREAERIAQLRALSEAAMGLALQDGLSSGDPLGRLTIDAIGLDVVVVEGAGRRDLREGPGHWPETPMPGLGGNFVVSGHRTTYGAPFFRLDRLVPGDVVELVFPYAALRYEVARVAIVSPTEISLAAPTDFEQLTLVTCHPIYSAKQRYLVQARLTAFKLL